MALSLLPDLELTWGIKMMTIKEVQERQRNAKIGFVQLWDKYKDSPQDTATIESFFAMLTPAEQH